MFAAGRASGIDGHMTGRARGKICRSQLKENASTLLKYKSSILGSCLGKDVCKEAHGKKDAHWISFTLTTHTMGRKLIVMVCGKEEVHESFFTLVHSDKRNAVVMAHNKISDSGSSYVALALLLSTPGGKNHDVNTLP